MTKTIQEKIESFRPWRYGYTQGEITISPDNPNFNERRNLALADVLLYLCDTIKSRINDFSSIRVLNLGCLEGHHSDLLCSLGFKEVVSVDMSGRHVARADFLLREFRGYENSTVVKGNVLDENFMRTLGTFEIILFHGLLYHLHSPLLMFQILDFLFKKGANNFLLLSHQYHMKYHLMASEQPLTEVAFRDFPLNKEGLSEDPANESVFDNIALILNAKALYKILATHGYINIVEYNTPYGRTVQPAHFATHIIATKHADPNLLADLSSNSPRDDLTFRKWTGSSADSYSFRSNILPVFVRLSDNLIQTIIKFLIYFRYSFLRDI